MNRFVYGSSIVLFLSCITMMVLITRYGLASTDLKMLSHACSQAPKFEIGGSKDKNGLVSQGDGFNFQGLSWLTIYTCTPGFITLTVEGALAAGELPQLDIAINGVVIDSQKFSARRTVKTRIPEPGLVTIAFVNDYYKADVRMAMFSHPIMDLPECHSITNVTAPFESAGTWDAIVRIGTVVRKRPPIIIRPCGKGILSILLAGQSGAGEYPTLSIKQSGNVLKTYQTDGEYRRLSINVQGEPVELAVENPYAKLLADRNIRVWSVSFGIW